MSCRSTGSLLTDRLYAGYRLKGSTGLYQQVGARWYDPALGRFIQPDTACQVAIGSTLDCTELGSEKTRQALASGKLTVNPQLLNRYAYAASNPLHFTDESGHWVRVAAGGIAVSFSTSFEPPRHH